MDWIEDGYYGMFKLGSEVPNEKTFREEVTQGCVRLKLQCKIERVQMKNQAYLKVQVRRGVEAEPTENPENHPEWKPCDYPAGSPEKIAVLQRRIDFGLPLYHPEDCKLVTLSVRGEKKVPA